MMLVYFESSVFLGSVSGCKALTIVSSVLGIFSFEEDLSCQVVFTKKMERE